MQLAAGFGFGGLLGLAVVASLASVAFIFVEGLTRLFPGIQVYLHRKAFGETAPTNQRFDAANHVVARSQPQPQPRHSQLRHSQLRHSQLRHSQPTPEPFELVRSVQSDDQLELVIGSAQFTPSLSISAPNAAVIRAGLEQRHAGSVRFLEILRTISDHDLVREHLRHERSS